MNHSKIVIPIKYLYYEISNLKVMEVKIVQSLGYGRLWKTTYLWTIWLYQTSRLRGRSCLMVQRRFSVNVKVIGTASRIPSL